MPEIAVKDGSVFESYDGFMVEYRDASHRYWLCEPIDQTKLIGVPDELVGLPSFERKPVVSVTSVLGIIDKPALRRWYGQKDAEATLDLERSGELAGIDIADAIALMRSKGLGAEAKREAGADRGTAVHDALQTFCEDGTVPGLGDFPDATRGYVQGLCAWLLDAEPEPELVEQIVGSPSLGIAGRFDLIAALGTERWLIDLKTSANAGKYPESHAQLEGYKLCFPECGIKPVDKGLIVVVYENGGYEAVPSKGEPQDFLDILACHKALGRLRGRLK